MNVPIAILHNSAGHLLGPARSLGGVIIGYLGARVFNPQPVSKVWQYRLWSFTFGDTKSDKCLLIIEVFQRIL